MLLERPGEVVTRQELQARLWPSDTYVGFDEGLNTAIRKLRTAFGGVTLPPIRVSLKLYPGEATRSSLP